LVPRSSEKLPAKTRRLSAESGANDRASESLISLQLYQRWFVGLRRSIFKSAKDGYSTSVCFNVYRVIAHESEHNTLTRSHDEQGFADTLMQSNTPTPNGSPDYWDRKYFLRCDLAGAQLEYGLADTAGKYGDCFATRPGHGVKGLNTTITISGTSFTRCYTVPLTVSGRLAVSVHSAYKDLSNTPLEGRVITIEKKPSSSAIWQSAGTATATGAASSTNWTKSLTSAVAGLWNYRATWTSPSSEYGINTSNTVIWNVNWTSTQCPLLSGV